MLQVHFQRGSQHSDGGVTDDRIDMAKFLAKNAKCLRHAVRIRYVGLNR
jgi:hypothetical protein